MADQTEADDEYDSTEKVERTDTGVSIEFQLKRGEGTRDEDKIKAKAKGETFEEAANDIENAKEYVRDSLAPDLRAIQPADEE